ncbi:AbrB/MazE/SpoVT family DNA-binding domain-containing protein [Cohnella yongneupensis]|uniref:AbrB/MazE/SpoVT family DNA-binding domain-containing protein n=1 Tax=Cohnella yongneupensis TaxID=425006 RepID=A0ABW0QUK3_9BACL
MLKATGIVRKVDDLGRVVIPIELRRTLGVDTLEIFVQGESIVLRKYAPGCTFCDNVEVAKVIHDKRVCKNCIALLNG